MGAPNLLDQGPASKHLKHARGDYSLAAQEPPLTWYVQIEQDRGASTSKTLSLAVLRTSARTLGRVRVRGRLIVVARSCR